MVSKGISLSELQSTVQRYGGRNIRVAVQSMQIFCDLDEAGLARLKATPGLVVKDMKGVKAASKFRPQVYTPYAPSQAVKAQQPIYAMSQVQISSMFYQLRELTSPPTTGEGLTIAVLDSGIRKTHRGLVGKVVHEVNFTSSPTLDDIFSHGTGVAFMAAGGQHALGQESGMAPGASLMNIKVLNDDGEGTVEDTILGLEHVYSLRKDAVDRGLPYTDPMYPNIINMSIGTEDDGDPDHPLRVAVRKVTEVDTPYGIGIYAAAGNSGPNPGTVLLPASMPECFAIGVVTFSPFAIWPLSSRGPARDGIVKPDWVFFGVDIVTAESTNDEAFGVKSGTSFSCPASCAGGMGLMMIFGNIGILTPDQVWAHRSPTDPYYETLLRLICVKPEGIPLGKDNDYGFGMPYGAQIMSLLRRGTLAASLQSVMSVLAVTMMVPIITRI